MWRWITESWSTIRTWSWGTIGEWAGAVATFVAVLVALRRPRGSLAFRVHLAVWKQNEIGEWVWMDKPDTSVAPGDLLHVYLRNIGNLPVTITVHVGCFCLSDTGRTEAL